MDNKVHAAPSPSLSAYPSPPRPALVTPDTKATEPQPELKGQPSISAPTSASAPASVSPSARPSLLLPPGGPPATIISPPTPVTPVDSHPLVAGASAPSEVLIIEEPEEYDSPEEGFETASTTSSSFIRTPAQQSINVPPPFSVSRGNSSSSSSMTPGAAPEPIPAPTAKASPASLIAKPLPTPSSPHVYQPRIPSPSSGSQDPRTQPGQRREGRHRRESSTHRVRETIYGETRSTVDGQRMVNQYRLGKTLGKGSYASVEHAIDVGTGIEYAVKEFSKARLKQQALQERQAKAFRDRRRRRPPPGGSCSSGPAGNFINSETEEDIEKTLKEDPLFLIRKEIAVMKKLDHPNVVHLFEAISVPNADSLFLVLEYLPGGVLMNVKLGDDDKDAKPPFSQENTREYFRQICLGLEYLHANGVAHRDIKPDNLLFNSDRTMVKLADFGVSEIFATSDDDRIKTTGGSPAYLSPESFTVSSMEIHGKAVDIWALGVTLYCMLTGRLPFNATNTIELFTLVRETDPVIPDDWNPALKSLVTGMLCKDPERRATMDDIRRNNFVTAWGEQPMMSEEENLFHYGKVFEEPTDEEINSAITSLKRVFTVIRAVQKMRRLGLSRLASMNTVGSMVSYTLSEEGEESDPPRILSGKLLDDGHSPELVESPGSSINVSPGTEPDPFDKAPPPMVASPELMASPPLMASPALNQSPEMVHSPEMVQSPELVHSPEMVDSPELVESPVMCASPVECASPIECMSPVDVSSSVQCASPLGASPVASPERSSPLKRAPSTSRPPASTAPAAKMREPPAVSSPRSRLADYVRKVGIGSGSDSSPAPSPVAGAGVGGGAGVTATAPVPIKPPTPKLTVDTTAPPRPAAGAGEVVTTESPVEIESPVEVESPITFESPVEVESPTSL